VAECLAEKTYTKWREITKKQKQTNHSEDAYASKTAFCILFSMPACMRGKLTGGIHPPDLIIEMMDFYF